MSELSDDDAPVAPPPPMPAATGFEQIMQQNNLLMQAMQQQMASQQQQMQDMQTARAAELQLIQQQFQQQMAATQQAIKEMAASRSPDKPSKSEQRKAFQDLAKFEGKDWKEWRYDFRSAAGSAFKDAADILDWAEDKGETPILSSDIKAKAHGAG